MYVLLIFIIVLFLLGYVAYSRIFLYWKRRGVPHPTFSKLFGNISAAIFLKKSLGQVYDEIYNAYPNSPYVGFYKMRIPSILIRDPELVKEVMIKNFNSFHTNDVTVDKVHDKISAKSPFFSDGEEWKTSRGQLTPSLTSNKIKALFPLMQSVSQNFINHLEDPIVANGGAEVKSLCQKYTMDVVALSVLGLEATSFTKPNTEYINNVQKVIAPGLMMAIKFTIMLVLPFLGKFLRLKFIPDETANYFKSIIRSTITYRKENNIERNDFIDTMKDLQLRLGNQKLTENDITAHAVSFFVDGFETSSVTLSFALYDLSSNVDVQEKVRKEIEQKLQLNNGILTFELMQEMTYLDKCLSETLRLHPAAMFFGKRCTKRIHLPPVDNNADELLVEPGTPIVIPAYSLHHDPKYFPNPDKFYPERFSNENSFTKCTYIPFGDGPRICIGQKFALAQIKTALVNLILNYDIRVNPKTTTPLEIDPTYFLLAAKGGIWLNFLKRKKHQ